MKLVLSSRPIEVKVPTAFADTLSIKVDNVEYFDFLNSPKEC
jgi:hypothetical protein